MGSPDVFPAQVRPLHRWWHFGDHKRKVRATQGATPANGRGSSNGKDTESATESYTAPAQLG
jgi:hypothetical protein